ncbi:MAG TPA: hypothetical protein VIJ79_02965 [Acidobacteriaceae bacterium]
MITETQLANVLQLYALGLFWAFLFFKMIPYARLDGFRQKMFAVRDELFDYAADGNIAFSHPAYVLLRRQMNGFIRYGHQLTVFRCLMTVVTHKVSDDAPEGGWSSEWKKALDSIKDDSVRKKLEDFHNRGMRLTIKRLLFGSPLLWCMTLLFMAQMLLQGATKGIEQLVRMASNKVFTGPINDRLIEETAQGEYA